MASKPEYVDLIGEATRQHRRRAAPLRIDRQARGRGDLEAQPLAAGDVQAVEAREPDTLDVGDVEAEGLALGHRTNKGRRRGALFISIVLTNSGTDGASDASGRRGADRNRSR